MEKIEKKPTKRTIAHIAAIGSTNNKAFLHFLKKSLRVGDCMKAAIYARFSSHNQREESIEGQVRACKRFAKEHGMTIVEIYADRGLSGLHADNRPEFQRMIQDSDHHRFEALIMWNLDRFSRDKYDTAVYKTRLKKNGVSLYYSDQSIPDTPEGIILESLLEGFAQYYSANLARNAKRGLQENARKCLWNGGCVPLGYLIDEHQRFVLEPIGAACVRMIFELYASGQSIKSIVCTLNEKGYKTVKGNRFRLGSIQGILRNRKYIGEYHASGITVPNGIPAIVDVQLFNDVQARLGVVASAKAHNKADIPYLLTTKVFCGHCGSPMIGESGTGKGGATYRYYKCSCRKNRKGTCDKKTEPKDWLEENVVRQTVKNVLRPEVIKEISENCAAALKADASDESLVQALKAQLAETDKALRNLLKAIEAGIISSTTRERMAELESQKSELEAQIAREQLRKPEITAEQISFWLESFLAGDIHDPKYQERIINALVRRVDVYDDGPEKQKLTIFYNITKNNRSFSKISISKCSDIECIALPKRSVAKAADFFSLLAEGRE
ncbi:MAG: recombinase family protein [Christensenellales bacterium]